MKSTMKLHCKNNGMTTEAPADQDDQGLSETNKARTGSKIDTPLTQPSSRPVRFDVDPTKAPNEHIDWWKRFAKAELRWFNFVCDRIVADALS